MSTPRTATGCAAAWEEAVRQGAGRSASSACGARTARGAGTWRARCPSGTRTGGWCGLIAVATDIDDKKRAEDTLARFKATLDATLDCVLMFEPERLTLTYANAGAARQLGTTWRIWWAAACCAWRAAFDEEGFRRLLAPLLDGTLQSQTYSTTHRRHDGAEVPVEVVLQYVPAEDGQGRFVSVARDVTERQRAEAALRMANEAKDAFLAAASHELRTPLAAVKGHAHLAMIKLGGPTDQGPGKSLTIINRQIDRMTKLVEELLDISRLQAGRLSLELERFELGGLVRETCDRMSVLSQSHPAAGGGAGAPGGAVGSRAPGSGAHEPGVQRDPLLARGRRDPGAARGGGHGGAPDGQGPGRGNSSRRSRRSSSSASAARTARSTAGSGWG